MARTRRSFVATPFQQTQGTLIEPQEVARVAFRLYEQRGREAGHALDDWLKAETIVREQHQRADRLPSSEA
jgi:hypothetical protein